jgi:single-stranded-DNA-specific exonuclease
MGAKYVDFLVPNRFEHGYGLSPEIVELAIQEKQISIDDRICLRQSLTRQVVIGNNHINSGCFCQCYPIET